MCLAQFAISYEGTRSKKVSPHEDVEEDKGQSETQHIVTWNPQQEAQLPNLIRLSQGNISMRLRVDRAILRMHKFREEKDPHEYAYSELLLYRPWRNEDELYPHDMEACLLLLHDTEKEEERKQPQDRRSKIEKVKEQLFPERNSVEEARTVLEALPDQRPQHYGDLIDAENEKDNEDQEVEGIEEDNEFAARDPRGLRNLQEEAAIPFERTMYKKIDISNKNEMLRSVRLQDTDQRFVFDKVMKFVKQGRACQKSGSAMPKPPLLKVHGGAGSGKSKLINDLAQWVEYWMSVHDSDKPLDCPTVLRLAFTGKAAHGVDGETINRALRIQFGNSHSSLPDKLRDNMRASLSWLKVLIIDEMSLVKSDFLYQINLRLQEIKQNANDFGGVAVLLFGDLLQLRPVKGNWIFDPPHPLGDFVLAHAIHPLWQEFRSVELRHNHRQGKDKQFGDMLNRIRKGKQTEQDVKVLKSHITKQFPKDAFFIYGKNKLVNNQNVKELSYLKGNLEILKAFNTCQSIKNYKPEIKNGYVAETPFLDEIQIKVGARIMITNNVDTQDGLTNGATGQVVEFLKDNHGRVTHVLVRLDDPKAGKLTQAKHATLLKRAKNADATPIGRVSFDYSLGKAVKGHSAKAKVIQFPLTLAWAISSHKCQGMTIRSPTALVADLNSCFCGGQAYVMLGRIQNLSQLYLMSFDEGDIKVDQTAIKESDKLWEEALNNPKNRTEKWIVKDGSKKLVSLNIQSLRAHLEDIRVDSVILQADVICLQETWCTRADGTPNLPGYRSILAGEGRGRGVGAFIRTTVSCQHKSIDLGYFQGKRQYFF